MLYVDCIAKPIQATAGICKTSCRNGNRARRRCGAEMAERQGEFKRMKTEKKYEQWKAITESDFVTLFIKTWFTYIASLRELNPDVKVFYR